MDRQARDDTIIRDILERIDDSAEVNQRDLSKELGIALGMTNSYIKRCMKKGWIKVRQVPSRRYRYYLTPKGFSEKARLAAEYFSDSLKFFRKARQSFDRLYGELEAKDARRIVLCGCDELTEIAVLCALDKRLTPVGILRGDGETGEVAGVQAIDGTMPQADSWVIATTLDAPALLAEAQAAAGGVPVTYPDILRSVINPAKPQTAQRSAR
ncbi:MAG: winged helix-turn-helix transcriptional regulator [Alphaproteobacteria bacterium]|jgi:DNA-binding MarR family transcriptional regulator|nr:winged helix-turn-helix transcriptional regulator [Alphaproteobacteria bacterium]